MHNKLLKSNYCYCSIISIINISYTPMCPRKHSHSSQFISWYSYKTVFLVVTSKRKRYTLYISRVVSANVDI